MARLSTTRRRKTVLPGVLFVLIVPASRPPRFWAVLRVRYITTYPRRGGVLQQQQRTRYVACVGRPCCILRYDPIITADGQWW